MSRAARREKLERELLDLEADFSRKLIARLRVTREGHLGAFGRKDAAWPAGKSDDRAALLEIQSAIEALRSDLGHVGAFELGERFRSHSAMRGPNDPGEPKLAAAFLEELGEA